MIFELLLGWFQIPFFSQIQKQLAKRRRQKSVRFWVLEAHHKMEEIIPNHLSYGQTTFCWDNLFFFSESDTKILNASLKW